MRKKLIIAGLAFIYLFVALWFWPSPAPDRKKVDPALLALVPPFSKFQTSYYMDGGSIGIRLVDSRGRAQSFALPVDSDHSYPRLFVGAPHVSEPGTVEIPFNTDTRRLLISWMEEHRNPADSSDLALLYLRGNLRDYVRLGGHAATNVRNRFFQ
jgi:hypothetical protein